MESRTTASRKLLALLVVAGAFALAAPAHATHFRYGHVYWRGLSGNAVEFVVQGVFRRDDNPSFNSCISLSPLQEIACTGPGSFPSVGDLILEDGGDTRLEFGDSSSVGSSLPGGGLIFQVTSISTRRCRRSTYCTTGGRVQRREQRQDQVRQRRQHRQGDLQAVPEDTDPAAVRLRDTEPRHRSTLHCAGLRDDHA